jgi:F-type H+-transporting ATPase subunit b
MVNIDNSLFIQIFNFLILLWILNLILYKPIRKILAERKQRIEGYLKDIKELGKQIDEEQEEITRLSNEARRMGFERKEALKQQGRKEEERILSELSAQMETKIGEMKEQIATDVAEARKTLKGQLDAFARELAVKILGRQVG